jgi:hypothetical protein
LPVADRTNPAKTRSLLKQDLTAIVVDRNTTIGEAGAPPSWFFIGLQLIFDFPIISAIGWSFFKVRSGTVTRILILSIIVFHPDKKALSQSRLGLFPGLKK